MFKNKSQREILEILEPIMDNCLDGSNEGDYEKHVKNFTTRLRSIVTPENLNLSLNIGLMDFLQEENLYY